jgi:carboxyl-terminal processing protease
VIGEEFLQHPLPSDTISSTYNDELIDIDPGLKPWYLRYYMPTLQKKETSWNGLIPALKQKSERRIAKNTEFLDFLKGENGSLVFGGELSVQSNQLHDYQMEETVNILKDMIMLEKSYHHSGIADY